MVNLEWYRTFKAVYQTGSLTAAAKALFIWQPNVSQHLSSLEVKVIWNGNVAAEHTLCLAYNKTRVTTDLVALMKQFTGV